MAFMVLGEVSELEPSMVNEESLGVLRFELLKEPRVFPFDCNLCGAQRPLKCIDPGVLMYQDYKCSDIHATCKTPPAPKATKRTYQYIPGCMVFAPIDPQRKTRWPGIIEHCPPGPEGFMIPGKTVGPVKAYFVTFIFPEVAGRRWVGGFIDAKEVKPFEQMKHLPFGEGSNRVEYDRSVKLANDSILLSLRERLLKFSFVAFVASMRQIPIGQGARAATNFWASFYAKRTADEPHPSAQSNVPGRAGFKLPKLELTEEWQEPEDSD